MVIRSVVRFVGWAPRSCGSGLAAIHSVIAVWEVLETSKTVAENSRHVHIDNDALVRFTLELASGNTRPPAWDALHHYCDGGEKTAAYLLVLLADQCATTGDAQKAGEQYARAGKLLLGERNMGLAQLCVDNLRKLGTHAAVADELHSGIEAASQPPAPPAGAQRTAADESFSPMKQRVVKA